MLIFTPPQVSSWPPWYCLTRACGIQPSDRTQLGGEVGDAVPASDPDLVGQHERRRAVDAGVVESLDARPGAGVDAGDEAERLDLLGPTAEERERRLAAGGVVVVEALEVVPEGAAGRDAQQRGRRGRLVRLVDALLERGRVRAVDVRHRADLEVVAVAREPGLAGGLRAEGDRQQPPTAGELCADPRRVEVLLGAARTRVAGDVDADRQVRRAPQPPVHRGLAGCLALVEAVAGEVARRHDVDLLGLRGGLLGARRGGGRIGADDHREAGDREHRDETARAETAERAGGEGGARHAVLQREEGCRCLTAEATSP